jgi:UDP-glucuronate 4-epimerase
MQAESPQTYADIDDFIHDTGYRPKTSVEEGNCQFVKWYKEYYGNKKILIIGNNECRHI